MTATLTDTRGQIEQFVSTLRVGFGMLVETGPAPEAPRFSIIKVILKLPVHDVDTGEETWLIADFNLDVTPGWSPDAVGATIRERAIELLTHEWDEWFASNNHLLFPPGHDGGMLHYQVPGCPYPGQPPRTLA